MFIVVDPFGLVPMFIGLSSRLDQTEKDRTIRKAVVIAFLVLALFILAGKALLGLLGIEPGSFFIAGGVMLFIVSLEMLFGQPDKSKVSSRELQAEGHQEEPTSIAVFPLAIPMLAGPGSITTILLYTGSETRLAVTIGMLFVSVLLTLAAAALAMKASSLILRGLGRTGVSVIERIMGLLLSGMSVQFIYNGLEKLGIIGGTV